MPYSSFGRPATALRATVSMAMPLKTHTSEPASLRSSLGALSWYFEARWSAKRSGGSMRWSSTLIRMRSSISAMAASPENVIIALAE